MRLTAAIFDMDGLLLDSERPVRDAWLQVCAVMGFPIDEAAYRGAIGRNARDSRRHIEEACGPGFDYDRASAQVAANLDATYGINGYPLKDGAIEILTWFQDRGLPVAVASSSSRSEVERRLTKAGIAPFFTAIAGGDEVAQGKPAPDLFLLAHARMNVRLSEHPCTSEHSAAAQRALMSARRSGGTRPGSVRQEDCIVFEDSDPGARAAVAAGMRVVIVPDLRPPSGTVAPQCLAVVGSLREALGLCQIVSNQA